MRWYIQALKSYAMFSGRARRKEYWMFFLFNMIIAVLLGALGGLLEAPIIGGIYTLAIIIPSISVGVRRLHDTDHRGWWILLPIVNFVFLVTEGTRGDNRFGSDPKGTEGIRGDNKPSLDPNGTASSEDVEQSAPTRKEITEATKATGSKNMLYGALWCIGGIMVTAVTYSQAANSGGGTYYVTWGAMIFGGLQFLQGLYQYLTAPRVDSQEPDETAAGQMIAVEELEKMDFQTLMTIANRLGAAHFNTTDKAVLIKAIIEAKARKNQ